MLLYEPPETLGKAAWAGLGRRLGSTLGASFVCIRASEDSQPSAIYVDIDQYLIRPVSLVFLFMHTALPMPASLYVPPSAFDFLRRWSPCVSSRTFFSSLECGEIRRIGSMNLDHSVQSSSNLDRLVYD